MKLILDNPVYQGKLAYRRGATREKVKGTKNKYQLRKTDDFIMVDGQHEVIVSEETWGKAHAKRVKTGVKQPSKTEKIVYICYLVCFVVLYVEAQCIQINTHGQIRMAHTRKFIIMCVAETSWFVVEAVITRQC